MDLRLRIVEQGEDGRAHWFVVQLLSVAAGEVLDADMFRWVKATKRVLLNPEEVEAAPLDMQELVARFSAPREANHFSYHELADIAARHFLRRQELIQRGVPGLAWTPTGFRREGGGLDTGPLAARRQAMVGAELLIDAPDVSGSLRLMAPALGTVTTISTDYDAYGTSSTKIDTGTIIIVRPADVGFTELRMATRFPLTSLPADDTVSNADIKTNVVLVEDWSSTAGSWDLEGYNLDGQADPSADAAADFYSRCDGGTPYVTGTTVYRTTGLKTVTLAGDANSDIEAAKDAVDRFTLAWNVAGQSDNNSTNDRCNHEASEDAGTDEAKLILTHALGAFAGFFPWTRQNTLLRM